jgi:amino acid transporter
MSPEQQAVLPLQSATQSVVRESWSYRAKCLLLGQPLVNEQLHEERLSKPLALGVLSSDCISSSAYGSEEMLLVLLPIFGIAAFTILMPLTGVILGVLLLVTLSYREVVMVYTKAGGSYVVARDNFGPTVAQVAAVALMLDYIVTVAVQSAAGTAALASAVPSLARWTVEITVGVVVLIFYGNLRGIREAGRAFAFPTYFFVGSMAVVIIVGLTRELFGDLPRYPTNEPGMVHVGTGTAIASALAVFYLLRAFANGGSSLTGLEAISNGVGAFRSPEGTNARRTLVVMSTILGSLVLGVSWLAHYTHAMPYHAGTPTVISQVAHAALGVGPVGHAMYFVVQLATMLILYTGANTSFNGFPFLTSFVAEDSFLPRQLTKRGHRLAFSNGIIVLAATSITLLIVTRAHVDRLVAFYAIGVFTGFSFAGFGMAKHFHRERNGRWRGKVAINLASGTLSVLVVVIFVVTKFTEGAWLVVLLFPILTMVLIRLNREYRAEARALEAARTAPAAANFSRHIVLVLVDSLDLATIRALRYARSLKPTQLHAVHFVIDGAHAERLRKVWTETDAADVPLELIECPDRRLIHAALTLSVRAAADGTSEVTLLMPRRSYAPLLGRLLHDRTADDIAQAVSQVPNVSATIVPFNVSSALQKPPEVAVAVAAGAPLPSSTRGAFLAREPVPAAPERPAGDGITPIVALTWRQRARIQGRVRSVRVTPLSGAPALAVEVWDSTGGITALFYGRRSIAGIAPGSKLELEGMVGEANGHLAMANPSYELLAGPPSG